MQTIHTRIEIGLSSPIRVLHASDTHLTHADMRDGQRKVDLAESRLRGFPEADQRLAELGKLSQELGLPIMHTGDLIDFVSLANLEAAKAFADSHDIFMATGNHEFSLYVAKRGRMQTTATKALPPCKPATKTISACPRVSSETATLPSISLRLTMATTILSRSSWNF